MVAETRQQQGGGRATDLKKVMQDNKDTKAERPSPTPQATLRLPQRCSPLTTAPHAATRETTKFPHNNIKQGLKAPTKYFCFVKHKYIITLNVSFILI